MLLENETLEWQRRDGQGDRESRGEGGQRGKAGCEGGAEGAVS